MQINKPHKYAAPPPAQAGPNDRICVHCGVRRSVAQSSECTGRSAVATAPLVSDYDPHNDV